MSHLSSDEVVTVSELRQQLLNQGFGENYSVAVEALIFDTDGRWMLMRRGASAGDEVGKLEGIGGRADESDVLREELLREVREEIGDEVEIEVVDFLELKSDRVLKAMADGSPIWKTWIIASYICKLVAGRPDIREPDKNEGFEYFSDLQLVDPRRLSSSCQQSLASLRASWPRLAPLLNA